MRTIDSFRRRLPAALAGLAVGALAATAAACGSSPTAVPPATSAPAATAPPTSAATTTAPTTAPSSSTSGAPSTTARAALADSLTTAYQTETDALATYRNVVSALGDIPPFANVVASEEQHVSTIEQLMHAHGVAVPAASAGRTSPSSRQAACDLGTTVEEHLIATYDQLLPKVSSYADVSRAFTNLRTVSHDSHLPAFEHCS